MATGIGISGSSFTHIVPYFISELFGAGIAAGLFKVARPDGEAGTAASGVEPTLASKLTAEFIGHTALRQGVQSLSTTCTCV